MKQDNWLQEGFGKLKNNRLALLCLYFIAGVCLMALTAKWITPYPFDEQHIDHLLMSPNSKFWFGTDKLGRDLLSRIIYGSRMSMAVGVITAFISLFIGAFYGAVPVGLVAGWIQS